MTALVRGVIAASIFAGLIQNVSESTSTKTGIAWYISGAVPVAV